MPTALLSVTDKQGLLPFAEGLITRGYHILSTGGTAKSLESSGIDVEEVSDFTRSSEMLIGRVKTLHPRVFGSILARPEQDAESISEHDLTPISLVIVNLYEFEQTIGNETTTFHDAIESIDIGGVSLIRAAAKNSDHVTIVVDPADYIEVLEKLDDNGFSETYRRKMAAKAFRHTAAYDALIANFLSKDDSHPEKLTLTYRFDFTLRYGENPHQSSSFYQDPTSSIRFEQIQGKKLSYNNIVDLDAAARSVQNLSQPACAIVKHANPCGLAVGESLAEAYAGAFRTDPTSAFGGVIAFNGKLDTETFDKVLKNQFVELLVVPDLDSNAITTATKRKNLRLVRLEGLEQSKSDLQVKTVAGGVLVQQNDDMVEDTSNWRVVTERKPIDSEFDDLIFAWHVVKHVKSNAIVFVRGLSTTGIGAGQMNRVQSVQIAAQRMREEKLASEPSVMASDAFFPFRDGIDEAAKAGISAVIQPGGSVRDEEVIQACDEHDIAMIFTGTRHFKH